MATTSDSTAVPPSTPNPTNYQFNNRKSLQSVSRPSSQSAAPAELPASNTGVADRQSLTIDPTPKQEQKERRRSSILSLPGNTAWRRRTYNGSTTSLTGGSTSRFSTTSFDTYRTATSYLGSWRTAQSVIGDESGRKERSVVSRTFRKLLERGGLSSLVEEKDDDEFDWCGRGMHVDFKPGETIPLEISDDSAGHGSTATVDIVKCRRIKLARKLTHVRRGISQKDLLREVQALRKLKHAHVVQLVGTYTKGRTFAALIYPVADMDLAHYLDEGRTMSSESDNWTENPLYESTYQDVLSKGSLCLISALRYVHECGVKHMDIKPANILLKRSNSTDAFFNQVAYRMYLCDFGISQIFDPEYQSQTESYPGKTPTYASPEVAEGERHGRASDIFSLGCVLVEMATVYSGMTVDSLRLLHLGNRPYHTQLDRVRSWVTTLDDMKVSREIIPKMLQEDPDKRPSLLIQDGNKNAIELECSHAHEPPDSFEIDESITPVPASPTISGYQPSSVPYDMLPKVTPAPMTAKISPECSLQEGYEKVEALSKKMDRILAANAR